MSLRRTTLVVSAMSAELAPLARRAGIAVPTETSVPGRGGALRLGVTGSGGEVAGRGLARLLASGSFERVLAIGLAGGLTAELDVGDLVRATTVRTPDAVVWSLCESEGPKQGSGAARPGVIVSSEAVVCTVAAKQRLADDIGVGQPAVVDLESASWVAAAGSAGVPLTIVRAVSDRLDEDLPVDFERFRDRSGRLSTWRVASHALVRPDLWKPLAELRRRLRLCAERLAVYALDELTP